MERQPYTGPRLGSWSAFPQWKAGFMAAMASVHLSQYFLKPQFEDLLLVSPALVQRLRDEAERAEPIVAPMLNGTKREMATHDRMLRVHARLEEAIQNEVACHRAEAEHRARLYLISALDTALVDIMQAAPTVFDAWLFLHVKSLMPNLTQQVHDVSELLERSTDDVAPLEGPMDKSLQDLLAMRGAADSNAWFHAIVNRLKVTLSTHAGADDTSCIHAPSFLPSHTFERMPRAAHAPPGASLMRHPLQPLGSPLRLQRYRTLRTSPAVGNARASSKKESPQHSFLHVPAKLLHYKTQIENVVETHRVVAQRTKALTKLMAAHGHNWAAILAEGHATKVLLPCRTSKSLQRNKIRMIAYAGPRLGDAAEIAAWTTQFLDAAAAIGLDKYFTIGDYTDASAALRVSQAKHHLIASKAEAMEPEVPSGLSASAHRHATQVRRTRVQDRIDAALAKEALAIGARDRRAAERYLLSAVDPRWHATLKAECGPYAKWKRLLAMRSTTSPHIPALLDAMSITMHTDEDWGTFSRRLNGPVTTYIDSIIAAGVAAAQDDAEAIAYSRSVGDKLRYHNTVQWSYESFQQDLQAQWTSRTETRDEDDENALLYGGGAYSSTDDADGRDATTVVVHDTEDEPMSNDAASSPRDSPTHRRAKKQKKKKKKKTAKLYCTYCHSKKHSDASCFYLAIAYRDKIVREGYTRPHGVPIPQLSDDLVESKRRFCTYCHSTKHNDIACPQLFDDVHSGSVRTGYADPDGQLMPTPARVKADESEQTPDTIEPKKELIAASLVPPTAQDEMTEDVEPSEDDHQANVAMDVEEEDDEDDEDDDVVITHVLEARSNKWSAAECLHLVALVDELGSAWGTVVSRGITEKTLLPSRTPCAVRDQYARLVQRGLAKKAAAARPATRGGKFTPAELAFLRTTYAKYGNRFGAIHSNGQAQGLFVSRTVADIKNKIYRKRAAWAATEYLTSSE
ncbi:hypothetical protein SPRG_03614 [Saprolegnia parasitica CBS 223.65]|uniref:Myb-like domain-containing protein n=1 Tax=Saprolegnia parasitica (strain CBS 223.65) TaxID=695850 RepID=A0A067CYX9_SAPPC|nr:hypothetical protein SPRG_03614 [Saprolegnia parasitica CBS 223.65]KDO31696.1 hypothetical protein SPRG_03614 [Saprolegnia parasitica CBS 223.65]|eukprot:XP_012197582.1 hypothetical protein SPRG_03614 [Saprolegnia parasitica CBS 223.65]